MSSTTSSTSLIPRSSVMSLLSAASSRGLINEASEIAGLYAILERQEGFNECNNKGWEIFGLSACGGLIGEFFLGETGMVGGCLLGAFIGLIRNRECMTMTQMASNMSVADKLQLLIHARRLLQVAATASRRTDGG